MYQEEEAQRAGMAEGFWEWKKKMGFYMWLSEIYKSLPLLSFENVAPHRDFVCPALFVLGVRPEFVFFFLMKHKELRFTSGLTGVGAETDTAGRKMHTWS